MKKTQSKKNRNTKAAIAATIMSVPIFGMPSKGLTQVRSQVEAPAKASSDKVFLKHEKVFDKHKGGIYLAGVGDGHTIYMDDRGDYFYIDPATGDMKPVSDDYFIKGESTQRKAFVLPHVLEKSGTINSRSSAAQKVHFKVSLLGVDQKGNVVQQNSKGEKFYLDTKTGDMVFVK